MTNKKAYAIIVRLKASRCGGIGRRHGLKIRWEEIPVPVRVRLSAPYSLLESLYRGVEFVARWVAKLKMIDYHFQRVKPPKARRITS